MAKDDSELMHIFFFFQDKINYILQNLDFNVTIMAQSKLKFEMYKKQISIDIKFDSVINDYTNVIQILRDKSLIVCIFSVAYYVSFSEWHWGCNCASARKAAEYRNTFRFNSEMVCGFSENCISRFTEIRKALIEIISDKRPNRAEESGIEIKIWCTCDRT